MEKNYDVWLMKQVEGSVKGDFEMIDTMVATSYRDAVKKYRPGGLGRPIEYQLFVVPQDFPRLYRTPSGKVFHTGQVASCTAPFSKYSRLYQRDCLCVGIQIHRALLHDFQARNRLYTQSLSQTLDSE